MTGSNSFDLNALRERLKPFRLHWYPRLRSTNDHAAALRKRGDLFAPAVVLTGHQTAGRGRGSNTWWSGQGSLTVTFVLAAGDKVDPHQLPLVAGLATRNAAAELTGDNDIQLKWPNDLLHRERKLAGLLCERVRNADLVGIGINVNVDPSRAPRELREKITSLSHISGREIDMNAALALIASHLRVTLNRAGEYPFGALLREYDSHHALIGRQVSVSTSADEAPIRGKCEGLDSIGRLVLRSRGQTHHVIAGQVQAF